MDDIDDLLNEAETFCLKDKKTKVEAKTDHKKSAIDDQVTSLLEEIDTLDTSDNLKSSSQTKGDGDTDRGRRQCRPETMLGGPMTSSGVSAVSSPRVCDNMLCLACNLPVIAIDHVMWDESTDYLFLRNNVPNIDKLRAKLKMKKGCRAYACQCQWRNVTEIISTRNSGVQWICRKH